MPAALLGQSKPAENTPAVLDDDATHTTAFLVLIDKNGNVAFEPDINKPVIPQRSPKPIEVKNALSALIDEIRSQEIAITLINMQMQMARQMQEQATSQQIMQQMNSMPRN